MKKSFFLCLGCSILFVSCSLLEKKIADPVVLSNIEKNADTKNISTPVIMPENKESIKATIISQIPGFSLISESGRPLPDQYPCITEEESLSMMGMICGTQEHGRIADTYNLFMKALRERDIQKTALYGSMLGKNNEYGFTSTKYRVVGDTFIGMNFGVQEPSNVIFKTYTVQDNIIIMQDFSIDRNSNEYKDWSKALMQKFNKNIDITPLTQTFSKQIDDFAGQYWYDRLLKMQIQ